MGNISPAGELTLGLSQGGGRTETGLSTWQEPTPLLHPQCWGGAVAVHVVGRCRTSAPGGAKQCHAAPWNMGRHGLVKGPSVTHVTGRPGTPIPGAVALQVLSPQLPCASLLWVQPCQAPDLLHWLLQYSLNRENMVLPSLFPCCSQCFSLRVSLLHWLPKCTHLQ